MPPARIDMKGHAPSYQFLNSSFILQYRKDENQRNMIFPLDNRHFITDSKKVAGNKAITTSSIMEDVVTLSLICGEEDTCNN